MEIQKRNLLIYLAVSAISFFVFVSVSGAGVSVPIFVAIQVMGLWHLLPQKKYILAIFPLLIFSLNALFYTNAMWNVSNFFVAGICYAVMVVWIAWDISFRDTTPAIFVRIFDAIISAFSCFKLPFQWASAAKKESMRTVRRILAGVALSIPLLVVVIAMLGSADMIFAEMTFDFINDFFELISFSTIWRLALSAAVGLFLFGILYGISATNKEAKAFKSAEIKGDTMIINIVLASILVVYTLFAVIQFRYLFAAAYELPYGLNFATYARRGFFELLFLSFVNIAFIIGTVWLTKLQTGVGAKISKFLCLYLCAATVLLLVSSFYRMMLYSTDFGLTRLRLLVFGFLIFEAIGLVFTFFYILKPKFNIILVYCVVALSYYMVLNLAPIDRIVARNQVDRYFASEQSGIWYVLSLSADAAPEVERLLQSSDVRTVVAANQFVSDANQVTGWRQLRLTKP